MMDDAEARDLRELLDRVRAARQRAQADLAEISWGEDIARLQAVLGMLTALVNAEADLAGFLPDSPLIPLTERPAGVRAKRQEGA